MQNQAYHYGNHLLKRKKILIFLKKQINLYTIQHYEKICFQYRYPFLIGYYDMTFFFVKVSSYTVSWHLLSQTFLNTTVIAF